MCVICVEWQAGKLTSKEAFRNLGEIINSTDDEETKFHLFGLSEKILDKEVGETAADEELDAAWHTETHGD